MSLQGMISRSRGMFVASEATLAEHGRPPPPVRIVMREHLIPLLAVTSAGQFFVLVVLAPLAAGFGQDAGFAAMAMIGRIALNLIGVWVTAAVLRFHAARLGGSGEWRAAFVLAALALTPTFVAEMAAPLIELFIPLFGVLGILAAAVYAMVLIHRGNGIVLGVPEEARGRHTASTVITLIVVSLLASVVLAGLLAPA